MSFYSSTPRFDFGVNDHPATTNSTSISTEITELARMPLYSSTPRFNFRVNDPLATTNLTSLLRKRKYFMDMIDSLEPAGDLNPQEAKFQAKDLDQFREKFTFNESEIATMVEDAYSSGEQLGISQTVLKKVRQIQAKLENIISSNKTIPSDSTVALSVRERILSPVDVEAYVKSLGSQSYLNDKIAKLAYYENDIYENILKNLDHPPVIAGSIHLRPWVDDAYWWFGQIEKMAKESVRQSPCPYDGDLGKVEEISGRVERAVEDYKLYCEGRIPKQHLNYISSMVKARGQKSLLY